MARHPIHRIRKGRRPDEDRHRPGGAKALMGRVAALLAMIALVAIPLVSLGAGVSHAADPSDEKYSFYKISSNLTTYFSNQVSPDHTGAGLSADYVTVLHRASDAGAMLGYSDPTFGLNLSFLKSELSGSSDSINYDVLAAYPGAQDYAYFGAANRDLGLDSTSVFGKDLAKEMSGGVVWVLYAVSAGVPQLFSFGLEVLKALNPFQWFWTGVAAFSPTFADGMVGGQANAGFLGGLVGWVGEWYQALSDLSWGVIVPLFLGFFLISLAFLKQGQRGSAVKKLVVRILFIGLGVPLLGSMYTQTLNAMSDSADGVNNSGATRMVASTYVDFEGWALNNRLAIPAGTSVTWDPNLKHATAESTVNVRNMALAINNQVHPDAYKDIKPYTSVGANPYTTWSKMSTNPGTTTLTDADANTYVTTLAMLSRYMANDKIEGSTFESKAKAGITGNADAKTWFEAYSDIKKMDNPNPSPTQNPLISLSGNGGLSRDRNNSTAVFTPAMNPNCPPDKLTQPDCNLSPLAMYNYLNTTFGPSSLIVYSPSNASSGLVREAHTSVSLVGTGPIAFVYWLNCVVILFSTILVGVSYAFGMILGSLRRTFEAVSSIPFAMLGVMASIAKVIVHTMALILEVLLTMFLYAFMSRLLVSLPQIIETPLAAALKSSPLFAAASVAFAQAIVVVLTVLSMIFVIGFTIMAIRVRKTVLDAVNEISTKLIEKFLEVQIVPPAPHVGGGMMPALAGGLAAGAGMAAAGRMMNGTGGPLKQVGAAASHGSDDEGDDDGRDGSQGPEGSGGSDGNNAGGTNGPTKTTVTSGSRGSDGAATAEDGDVGPEGSGGSVAVGGGAFVDGSADPGVSTSAGTARSAQARAEADQATAAKVAQQGGLSQLGVAAGEYMKTPQGKAVVAGAVGAVTAQGEGPLSSAVAGAAGAVSASSLAEIHGTAAGTAQAAKKPMKAPVASGGNAAPQISQEAPTVPTVRGTAPTAAAPGAPAPTTVVPGGATGGPQAQAPAAPQNAPAPQAQAGRTPASAAPQAGQPATRRQAPEPAGRSTGTPAGTVPSAPMPGPQVSTGRPGQGYRNTGAPQAPARRQQIPAAPAAGSPRPAPSAPAVAPRPFPRRHAPAAPAAVQDVVRDNGLMQAPSTPVVSTGTGAGGPTGRRNSRWPRRPRGTDSRTDDHHDA